jgi:hypothetical protein
VIDPHPTCFEAQVIADAIASAIDHVGTTHKQQILKCNTMRLAPDWWRQYSIRFDSTGRQVIVKPGPIVNTSQLPLPESESPEAAGRATVRTLLLPTYDEFITVDIFGGPSLALEWRNERVEIDFIPWHRQYSHSVFMALLFGILCGALFGLTAGLIGFIAVMAHVLQDQLGYLGSNLWWPLTRVRTTGARLIHAMEPLPNFFTVGTSLYLILFNLDRFSAQPRIDPLFFWAVLWLPFPVLLLYFVVRKFERENAAPIPLLTQQKADLVAETQEVTDA